VLDFLHHLLVKFANDREYKKSVQQCIDAIEK
jgi:hypothetical protein